MMPEIMIGGETFSVPSPKWEGTRWSGNPDHRGVDFSLPTQDPTVRALFCAWPDKDEIEFVGWVVLDDDGDEHFISA